MFRAFEQELIALKQYTCLKCYIFNFSSGLKKIMYNIAVLIGSIVAHVRNKICTTYTRNLYMGLQYLFAMKLSIRILGRKRIVAKFIVAMMLNSDGLEILVTRGSNGQNKPTSQNVHIIPGEEHLMSGTPKRFRN